MPSAILAEHYGRWMFGRKSCREIIRERFQPSRTFVPWFSRKSVDF